MTAFYGDRLIATHINDNLGVKSFDGTITWHDDLHLLPFDGIADWENVARRIADVGYDGILTFELLRADKPGRFCNMKYRKMSPEEYLSEAYARACKVSAMVQKCKQ
jgi:sugar phosphate isomerase/epimerase